MNMETKNRIEKKSDWFNFAIKKEFIIEKQQSIGVVLHGDYFIWIYKRYVDISKHGNYKIGINPRWTYDVYKKSKNTTLTYNGTDLANWLKKSKIALDITKKKEEVKEEK